MEIESEVVGAVVATYVVGGVAVALVITAKVVVVGIERGWRALRGRRS